jgi:predicted metalloprotease
VLEELDADCLAGVWGRSAYSRADVTNTELENAPKTAAVIGDDYLAEAAGQVVDSSLWTHGSSKQRQYWLRKGFRSGRPDSCDTFAGG